MLGSTRYRRTCTRYKLPKILAMVPTRARKASPEFDNRELENFRIRVLLPPTRTPSHFLHPQPSKLSSVPFPSRYLSQTQNLLLPRRMLSTQGELVPRTWKNKRRSMLRKRSTTKQRRIGGCENVRCRSLLMSLER
jgi:hypothetical protein